MLEDASRLTLLKREVDGKAISINAEPANGAQRDRGQERVVAKCFALMDIRDVYLDERDRNPGQCIAQGHAGMGQAAGIDDDGIDSFGPGRMNTVDQGSFMIALEASNRRARRSSLGCSSVLDVGEGSL